MSATHYLLTVKYGTKPANKLQEGIYEDLKTWDRMLVKADKLETLKSNVQRHIDLNNNVYAKCKPVTAYWNDADREEPLPSYHLSLHGLTFMYVKILGVKEVQL